MWSSVDTHGLPRALLVPSGGVISHSTLPCMIHNLNSFGRLPCVQAPKQRVKFRASGLQIPGVLDRGHGEIYISLAGYKCQLVAKRNLTVPRYLITVACLFVLLVGAGCSSEDIVDPNKLCKEGAGIAARIDGTSETVDMCVPNDQTTATYDTAPAAHYEISAAYTSGPLTIAIATEFFVHPPGPVKLTPTSDIALARADPGFVYFSYQETQGVQEYSSIDVAGSFTLTFSDASIAVASFSDLTITLEDTASPGAAVATRKISEGFVSVLAD